MQRPAQHGHAAAWHLSGTVRPYLALTLGVGAVSSAAILISLSLAQGVPALAVAALRMVLASIVVVPVALLRRRAEIRVLAGRQVALSLASGGLLALHFAFWISSLDYTSVMSSVVLVSTNPLFVALASVLLLRERVGLATVAGIAVAICGAAVIGLMDVGQAGASTARGDVLALLGALCASGYILLGRRLRKDMSLTLYIGLVYPAAAVVLLGIASASGTRLLGYPVTGYMWVVLLAAGPQLLGHTAYNWALKYVSATFVTVTLLAEPIGATLLAIPVLSQVPSGIRIAGGMLVLAGIFLAARAESRLPRGITADSSRQRRAR
jgi:drug/metabolite transporter (DMT)-like permease